MKLKPNFIIRQVADSWLVVAVGKASVDFNGLLTLNETGALLWKTLQQGADLDGLAAALTQEYEVSPQQAKADAQEFLDTLSRVGCLEE